MWFYEKGEIDDDGFECKPPNHIETPCLGVLEVIGNIYETK